METLPAKQRLKSRQSLAHVSSKSNTTTDIAALRRDEEVKAKAKRTRGKSLGPGGLEALTETNGNVFRIPPMLQPKSILKPTVPLTPPKAIPSFHELRNRSTTKHKSPAKIGAEELLIDFSTPGVKRDADGTDAASKTQDLIDPFSPQGLSQDDAAFVEEERLRQEQKKAILEQRAARRKSMGARRVSFAPEATLHTWSEMEMMEDSTTSSAANTTRRQSSMTTKPSPVPSRSGLSSSESPDEVEKSIDNSQVSQRELHQRKRRRISDQSQSEEDDTFSSPGDGVASSPIRVEDGIESDSDTDGDTAMSLDGATQDTIRSSGSSSTQTSLDERLRSAATQAGVASRVFDSDLEESDEDQPMDMADTTTTHAFRAYGKQPQRNRRNLEVSSQEYQNHEDGDGDATYPDLSNLDPTQTDMAVTMDITRAVGGIISGSHVIKGIEKDRTTMSVGHDTSFSDETMDMTVAKGGILSTRDESIDAEEFSDEEVTMDMTRAMGGIRNSARSASNSLLTEETESMDMTLARGGILPPIEEQTEPQSIAGDEVTSAMDMTRPVGGILARLPPSSPFEKSSVLRVDNYPTIVRGEEPGSSRSMAHSASETGSPTMKPRLTRRSINTASTSTPISAHNTPVTRASTRSPIRTSASPNRGNQATPSKQMTPAPVKSVSAKRTPVLPANVATRSASPKKLFVKELQQRVSPGRKKSPGRKQDILFSQDATTGLQTPKVILHAPKPHQHLRRQSNGLGLDTVGLGSPSVVEILNRRTSIAQTVPDFNFSEKDRRQLRFEDPSALEQEVDRERAEEHRRESGRFVMGQEVNESIEDNNTASLRDMIESMTPKKNLKAPKPKARKSLAIGSARGLLGKRPAELDVGDDEEESTPKRLRTVSREASPVKKIHLPKPPSKEETTGRLTKKQVLGLSNHTSIATPTLNSSPKTYVDSPSRKGHFRSPRSAEKPVSFEQRLDNVIGAADMAVVHPETSKEPEEKVSLQEFLNMTNIHFIELSTTKRRHTTMAATENAADGLQDQSSSAVFKAAATTLPLLDLYQHATRELKAYISSGRRIIRQIEEDTLNDQPLLFKQYLDASPDLKLVMENQFRSGKANSRLQSKEGWYTWRRQLVDGLQAGLDGIKGDLTSDLEVISAQQLSLQEVVPQLASKNKKLQIELNDIRQHLEQLNNVDHDLLKAKRDELSELEDRLVSSVAEADTIRKDMYERNESLESVTEMKQELSAQVEEALRVQDEQRTWRPGDVEASKCSVQALEKTCGWGIESAFTNDAGDVSLKMKYVGELELTFCPSQFNSYPASSKTIEADTESTGEHATLCFAPEHDGQILNQAQKFMLDKLQSYVHTASMKAPGSSSSSALLRGISKGWVLGKKLNSEIRSLESLGIVRVSCNDQGLEAKLTFMLPERARIDISFAIDPALVKGGDWSFKPMVSVSTIYGPASQLPNPGRLGKIQNALVKEAEGGSFGSGSWFHAVRGFTNWLQSRDTVPKALQSAPPTQVEAPQQIKLDDPFDSQSPRRARTTSPLVAPPQTATTPRKAPSRSPLAPKTTNSRVAKRALPVAKKTQFESLLPQPTNFRESQMQKENLPQARVKESEDHPGDVMPHENMSYDEAFGLTNGIKPAIPPDVQEAMMHTPMKKRAGALRRSPL